MSTMSTNSERITAAELERSKRARTIARNWLEAEETRMKLAGLDPALEGDGTPGASMRPSKFGRPSPLDRVKEARISGMEVAHFEKGLSGSSEATGQSQRQTWTTQQALEYARYLASLGKTPEEVQKHIQILGSTLDMAASPEYRNPFFQNTLMARTSESERPFSGVKDFVEIVQMVKSMQPPQNDSTAAIITALGSFMASTRPSGNDSGTVAQLYQQMSDQQQKSFDRHLELIRERMNDSPSFAEQLQQIASLQGTLGKISGRESESIQAKRMDLEHERWKVQTDADTERKKSAAQNDMVKTAFGNLGKILESPVIKEAGRGIGQALGKTSPRAGGVVNAVTGAPQTAARTELNTPPTQVPWGLVCHKCHTQHTFTQLQLAQIEESGGRWSCGKCGEVYELRRPPEAGETSGGT
jgi:hypothetical protein